MTRSRDGTAGNGRIGVSADACPKLAPFLTTAVGTGFSHVEIRILDVDPTAPMHTPAWRDEVRNAASDQGLTLSVHAVAGLNLAEKLPRLRRVSIDILEETVTQAAHLGAAWVTVHLGTCGLSSDHPKTRDRLAIAIESIEEALRRTTGCTVALAIENMVHFPETARHCHLGSSPAEFMALAALRSDPRVRTLFDLGHSVIARDAAWAECLLDAMSDDLVATHLHWNDRTHDRHWALTTEATRDAPFLGRLRAREGEFIAIFENHSLEEAITASNVWRSLGNRTVFMENFDA
jgi:sugar phosphate isomerase/epimerase